MLKPSKQEIFEMVTKTKTAAIRLQELKAMKTRSHDHVKELDSLLLTASNLNKELKAALALFTENERNAMREEFDNMGRE